MQKDMQPDAFWKKYETSMARLWFCNAILQY